MNELDDYIEEFHRVEKEEIELFLNFNPDAEWPNPSASKLWFKGLKRFGQAFIQ